MARSALPSPTGFDGAFGVAAYVIPLVLIAVGVLMLVRSEIVDLKPFRTGLAVGAFGLMIALGRDEGGAIGGALGGGLAHVIGDTGALIVGVALFIAGHAPLHRCLGRRRPSALRHRRPAGGERRTALARRLGSRRARRTLDVEGEHAPARAGLRWTLSRAIPT